MSDDQTVSYPLSDVLSRIENKVDRIDGKLDQQVAELDGRVRSLEVERAERAKAREVNHEHLQQAVSSHQARWAIILGGAGVLAAVAEAIVQAITSAH